MGDRVYRASEEHGALGGSVEGVCDLRAELLLRVPARSCRSNHRRLDPLDDTKPKPKHASKRTKKACAQDLHKPTLPILVAGAIKVQPVTCSHFVS